MESNYINARINELYNLNLQKLKLKCKEYNIKKCKIKKDYITKIFLHENKNIKDINYVINEIELINNVRNNHGMSSKNASRKKINGHKNEDIFAKLIGGNVISGQKKTDVKLNDINFSCKKECKRIQFALYSKTNPFVCSDHPVSKNIKECIELIKSKTDYQKNKPHFKIQLQPLMQSLYMKLNNKQNLEYFLKHIIFNNEEIDYLSIKYDGYYHIYSQTDIIKLFLKKIIVENSKARISTQYDDQKGVFKVFINNKKINLIENEIRMDKQNFLSVCNTDILIKLLNMIEEQRIDDDKKIIYYGTSTTLNL
jgi:hypothetical protein